MRMPDTSASRHWKRQVSPLGYCDFLLILRIGLRVLFSRVLVFLKTQPHVISLHLYEVYTKFRASESLYMNHR